MSYLMRVHYRLATTWKPKVMESDTRRTPEGLLPFFIETVSKKAGSIFKIEIFDSEMPKPYSFLTKDLVQLFSSFYDHRTDQVDMKKLHEVLSFKLKEIA